jgi:hypothetical protein
VKIEKLGTEFEIPIKDAIDQISGYEIKNGNNYKKVLDEKVIPYSGDMLKFYVGDKTVTFTPWHICQVLLNDNNEVTLYAKDVEEGMKFTIDGQAYTIKYIENCQFDGYVYGFEVEGMENGDRFVKADIVKNTYNDGSIEFVLASTPPVA